MPCGGVRQVEGGIQKTNILRARVYGLLLSYPSSPPSPPRDCKRLNDNRVWLRPSCAGHHSLPGVSFFLSLYPFSLSHTHAAFFTSLSSPLSSPLPPPLFLGHVPLFWARYSISQLACVRCHLELDQIGWLPIEGEICFSQGSWMTTELLFDECRPGTQKATVAVVAGSARTGDACSSAHPRAMMCPPTPGPGRSSFHLSLSD